ncbi:MAG: hypothetical protein K2W82_19460 [Candidatus Obscuribacterales bacterium]|nr:hypothetical protein [Candidatus Obscuribacterales bacterium]
MATLTQQPTQPPLRFFSRPYQQRIGLIPTTISIVLGWVITALGFISACYALQYYRLTGALMMLAVFCLGFLMTFITHRFISEIQEEHELYINGNLLSLSRLNKDDSTHVKQELSLSEVSSAEYYPAADTSNMVLHGKTADLEIPLWSFGPKAEEKIVQYIKAHDVQVVDIPGSVVI